MIVLVHYPLFQFWSAYVPCDTQYKDAVRQTLEQIDVIHRMCQKYPETFMFASSSEGKTLLVGLSVSLRTCQCFLAESHIVCLVCPAQTSWQPLGWTRQPVWLVWRGVTPSTAVLEPFAPCTSWGSATSHSHTPATHPGESHQRQTSVSYCKETNTSVTLQGACVCVCVYTYEVICAPPGSGIL